MLVLRAGGVKRPPPTHLQEHARSWDEAICLGTIARGARRSRLPSIDQGNTKRRLSFQGERSAEHFCPMTSNPPWRSGGISLKASTWGRGGERKEGGRGGGEEVEVPVASVTLEEIR